MPAKNGRLSVLGKQVDIGGVAGVKVEHVLPSGAHPLRGYGYEPVDVLSAVAAAEKCTSSHAQSRRIGSRPTRSGGQDTHLSRARWA